MGVCIFMSQRKSYFNIPKLDFSRLGQPKTDAEMDAIYEQVEKESKSVDLRAFVERMEKHPEALTAWDMSITFDEFARRVRAGEYD